MRSSNGSSRAMPARTRAPASMEYFIPRPVYVGLPQRERAFTPICGGTGRWRFSGNIILGFRGSDCSPPRERRDKTVPHAFGPCASAQGYDDGPNFGIHVIRYFTHYVKKTDRWARR